MNTAAPDGTDCTSSIPLNCWPRLSPASSTGEGAAVVRVDEVAATPGRLAAGSTAAGDGTGSPADPVTELAAPIGTRGGLAPGSKGITSAAKPHALLGNGEA